MAAVDATPDRCSGLQDALQAFATVLERERAALEKRDADLLADIAAEKQRLAGEIVRLQTTSPAPPPNAELRAAIEHCARLNRANGIAIAAGIDRLRTALRIVSTHQTETYAADGTMRAFSGSSRSIAKG